MFSHLSHYDLVMQEYKISDQQTDLTNAKQIDDFLKENNTPLDDLGNVVV